MSKNGIFRMGTTMALILMLGGAAHAAQTGAAPGQKPALAAKSAAAAKAMTSTGTIASIDAGHVTINHQVKGKDESTTFVLKPDTQRDATLTAGARVSIRYHKENNDLVASSVHAQTATAKASASKAKTGAKKG
jgi:Domain of unknown function (DUF5666)